MSLGQQQQRQQALSYVSDHRYIALILEEVEKLYNKLTIKLTNRVIAAIRTHTLPSLVNYQKLNYKNDTYDEIEETKYNNQPEIYNNNQEKPISNIIYYMISCQFVS